MTNIELLEKALRILIRIDIQEKCCQKNDCNTCKFADNEENCAIVIIETVINELKAAKRELLE